MGEEIPYTRLPRPTLWLLRGGVFTMGGDEPDQSPRFEAEVRSLYISKSVLTNEEYEAYDPQHVRGETSQGDQEPVVNVSFADALGYCAWYSQRSGKSFRLPTEVEWEFACRGGSGARYFWGDDPDAGDPFVWDAAVAAGCCHQVELLRANPVGLHDMLGNVWELTSSCYLPYPIDGDRAKDRDRLEPAGPRVIRGGSFRTPRAELGCAARGQIEERAARDDLGFRIVRLL